jgi:outer membrane protein OmpA-like peptidoglycan-associated protein
MAFRTSFLALFITAACSHSEPPPAAPAPAPAPAADPAPAGSDAEEPETEPVTKEEPKTLDIQKDVIRLKPGMKILFATDSDKIADESNPILDEVASVMDQNQRIRIRVEGHTDSQGDAAHNKELSARRAAAVQKYLESKGVAGDRVESTGCGQDTPIADNSTDDGRQLNRRVEFVILRHHRTVPECRLYHPGEHHHHHDHD